MFLTAVQVVDAKEFETFSALKGCAIGCKIIEKAVVHIVIHMTNPNYINRDVISGVAICQDESDVFYATGIINAFKAANVSIEYCKKCYAEVE